MSTRSLEQFFSPIIYYGRDRHPVEFALRGLGGLSQCADCDQLSGHQFSPSFFPRSFFDRAEASKELAEGKKRPPKRSLHSHTQKTWERKYFLKLASLGFCGGSVGVRQGCVLFSMAHCGKASYLAHSSELKP